VLLLDGHVAHVGAELLLLHQVLLLHLEHVLVLEILLLKIQLLHFVLRHVILHELSLDTTLVYLFRMHLLLLVLE
jgi:hypothetical protein